MDAFDAISGERLKRAAALHAADRARRAEQARDKAEAENTTLRERGNELAGAHQALLTARHYYDKHPDSKFHRTQVVDASLAAGETLAAWRKATGDGPEGDETRLYVWRCPVCERCFRVEPSEGGHDGQHGSGRLCRGRVERFEGISAPKGEPDGPPARPDWGKPNDWQPRVVKREAENTTLRENAKLVIEDAYRSKLMYEKARGDAEALLTAARHLLDCSQASERECPACLGRGIDGGLPSDGPCPKCDGTGKIEPFEVEALRALECAVSNFDKGESGG